MARAVRTARSGFADLFVSSWPDMPAQQAALDERTTGWHATCRSPITDSLSSDTWQQEQALLPTRQELFNCVVVRRVSRDYLVRFDGRRYTVPIVWIGRGVKFRGAAQHLVLLAEGYEIARHTRRTGRVSRHWTR